MTFDEWFGEVVNQHYLHAKDFSDKEKFPLPCVYRWLRGACLPRPIQISLICEIATNKMFEKEKHQERIAYDILYASVCSEVMVILKRDLPAKKCHEKSI